MNFIKNKFVVVDGEIKAGRVELHKDLHESPDGGGWWFYCSDQNKLILFGDSFDFGSVTEDQIRSSKLSGSFRSLTNPEIILDPRNQVDALDIMKDHLGEEEGAKELSSEALLQKLKENPELQRLLLDRK